MATKPKNTLSILLLVTGLICYGCHSKKHPSAADDSTQKPSGINRPDEDFDSFSKKFGSDSVFQKSRIVFPLKSVIDGDEGDDSTTKFIKPSEMHYLGLFVANSKNRIIKKTVLSKNKVQITFQVNDTGIEEDFFFERRDHNWYLVLVEDNSD